MTGKDPSDKRGLPEALRLLADGVSAGIWSWDPKTGEIWRSQKYLDMLGYTCDEMPGKYEDLPTLIHPDDREMLENSIRSHMDENSEYQLPLRIRKKSGEYEWFQISGKLIRDEAGEPFLMSGLLINIHERREVELEKQKSNFLLSEAGKIAKLGAWEYNANSRELIWSEEIYKIHELPEDYKPDIEKATDFFHPGFRAMMNKAFYDAVEKGKPYDLTCKIVTAKGYEKWVRVKARPEMDPHGKLIALRGVFQDIHRDRMKQQELQKSLDLLAKQNEKLMGFTHIVSHNLRSHSGNLEVLLEYFNKVKDEQERQRCLEDIKRTTHYFTDTLNHLHEVIQIQNNPKISRTLLRFEDVARRVVRALQPTFKENHKLNLNFEVKSVRYPQAYLESIFFNLISNAYKYRSPEREPEISVRTYNGTDGRAVLEVSDNGLGINLKRHRHKIFGMYKTFHRNNDARGVGLFITKNQVEVLGGKIEVESTEGVGSTFRVIF